MSESAAPKKRGRPATGETPHRKMRIEDELWTEVERLAAELAARDGTKPNVTAYVKEALRRENERVSRLHARRPRSK
jgi:hypothetical protein